MTAASEASTAEMRSATLGGGSAAPGTYEAWLSIGETGNSAAERLTRRQSRTSWWMARP